MLDGLGRRIRHLQLSIAVAHSTRCTSPRSGGFVDISPEHTESRPWSFYRWEI
jgi:hypothetical protein